MMFNIIQKEETKTLFRLWTHNEHHMPCLYGGAVGVISECFGEKIPQDIESALY